MFIPYGTDAPIYYWPKATVGLIVANVLVFFATAGMDPDHREALMLSRGDGLHPVEWVTSFFMHADLGHLIGNMIFLWAFGIIVEGKLGALKYVPLYFAIGTLHSALMQVISLRDEGYILGASAAIYGLMAICLVWAPMNELNCLWFWRFIPHQVDIAVLWFAIFYIGMEFVVVTITHAQMRTEFLHLTGAMLGFAAGVVMVKAKMVDCENWDLFAVMAGRKGMTARQAASAKARSVASYPKAGEGAPAKPKRKAPPAAGSEDPGASASRRFHDKLNAGEYVVAEGVYDRAMRTLPGWQPDSSDWLLFIKGLLDVKEWRLAVKVMEDYIRRDPTPSPRVRIKLAQVLLKNAERPAHALRILDGLPTAQRTGDVEKHRLALTAEANAMLEEGVLELEGEGW